MKRLSQLSLITLSIGLTACVTAPVPQQVSAPVIVAPAPIPMVLIMTDELVAATTAVVETPEVLVPRFATEAELKAAEARQKSAARNTRRNRTVASAAPAAQPIVLSDTTNVTTTDSLNVGEFDGLLQYLVEKAGNYPPRFSDRRERYMAAAETKQMVEALDQLVVQPNASFELLIRAVQLNQVARNLDIGAESAVKAGVYMRRAIALKPEDASANYWYGTMLTEGGGFKEGIPYLNRAAQAGYKKAYLGLAEAYLHIDQRPNALSALESYSIAVPEQYVATNRLIEQIREGKNSVEMP